MSYIDELVSEAVKDIRANNVSENEQERWLLAGILKIRESEPEERLRESAITAFRDGVAELLDVEDKGRR